MNETDQKQEIMEGGGNSGDKGISTDLDEDESRALKNLDSSAKTKDLLLHEKLKRKKQYVDRNMEGSDNSDTESKENYTEGQNIWKQGILFDKIATKCSDVEEMVSHKDNKDSMIKFSPDHCSSVSLMLQSSVENLMQYAEILYKCKLCTTLPSILTSKDTFLSHVSDQHLSNSDVYKECTICSLKFGTEEDLRAHHTTEHAGEPDSFDSKDFSENIGKCEKHKTCTSEFVDNKLCSDEEEKDDVICSEQGSQESKSQEHPKLVITHGEMRNMPCVSAGENITKLQKLTDQILASNKKEIEGIKKNISPSPSLSVMTPNYTAEFGKYTKLVREGGNIVYFCQLCNWKTQVKLQFQGHCANSSHMNKVKAAGQNDNEAHSTSNGGKTSEHKGQTTLDSRHGDREYKEPVAWTPRGHMSYLTETSGFYIGHSQTDNSKEQRNLKHRSVKSPSPSPPSNQSTVNETPTEKANPHNKMGCSEKLETKLNKRKRSAPVVLRNQSGCEDGWGSDELDNELVRVTSPVSPVTHSLANSGGKKRLLDLSTREGNDKNQLNNSPPPSLQMTPTCGDNVGGELREITPLRMEGKNLDKEQTTPSRVLKEEDLERTTAMIKQYFENHLGFRGLDQPLKPVSDPNDWPVPGKTFARNGNHPHSISTPPYSVREQMYLYTCSLCEFGCHDIQDYRLHFENEHSQNQDVDPYETVSDGRGESWKMWKIKELLPDLICVYPRGNVSRDLLLQKISIILNIPEVVQWGPACNKAVREQFPHSLAQRKGKYKKFFFGVAFLEQLQEQEDVSEGEGVQYQPLRDMSQDMEKIMGHLHSLVHWTGNMDSGISRDEILELLKGRIEEPDVQHWGVQCNRAIRVLFPNVEMKRKGKYKTTVFFGVDFRHDMHKQTFIPNKRGRPKKSVYFHGRDPDEMLQGRMNWLDSVRSTGQMDDQSFVDIGNHGESRSDRSLSATRGWGPGSLFNMLQTYNSRDQNESPVMFIHDPENLAVKMQYIEEEDSELSPPEFRGSNNHSKKSELFNSDRTIHRKLNAPKNHDYTSQGLDLSFHDNYLEKDRSNSPNPTTSSEHFVDDKTESMKSTNDKSNYNCSKLFNIRNLCQSSVKDKTRYAPFTSHPLPFLHRSCYNDNIHEKSSFKFRPWSQSAPGDTSSNANEFDEDDEESKGSVINENESGDGDDEDSNEEILESKLHKTKWRTCAEKRNNRVHEDVKKDGCSKSKMWKDDDISTTSEDVSESTDRGNFTENTQLRHKNEHKQGTDSKSVLIASEKTCDKNQNGDTVSVSASEAKIHMSQFVVDDVSRKVEEKCDSRKEEEDNYRTVSQISENCRFKSFNNVDNQNAEAVQQMPAYEQSECNPKP